MTSSSNESLNSVALPITALQTSGACILQRARCRSDGMWLTLSNTSWGLRSMSPGVGSSFLVDRLIRPRSESWLRIITCINGHMCSATCRPIKRTKGCSEHVLDTTSLLDAQKQWDRDLMTWSTERGGMGLIREIVLQRTFS